MAGEPTVTIKKTKRGTSIEFKNINMKPEELHKFIVEGREATRPEKERYLAESIAELHGVENNDKLKAVISDLTDAELDAKVEFADYLEGK
jgi:hypothetical protein